MSELISMHTIGMNCIHLTQVTKEFITPVGDRKATEISIVNKVHKPNNNKTLVEDSLTFGILKRLTKDIIMITNPMTIVCMPRLTSLFPNDKIETL
jgi:hypothetical protein